MQQEKFQSQKEKIISIQSNYKKLGFVQAKDQVMSLLKETILELKKSGKIDPTSARFLDPFGTIFVDPHFILTGIRPGHDILRDAIKVGRGYRDKTDWDTLISQEETTQETIENLKSYYGRNIDLVILTLKGDIIPIDTITNLINWLTENGYKKDTKVLVIPKVILADGHGLFDKGRWEELKEKLGEDKVQSPYYPYLKNFYDELTSLLNGNYMNNGGINFKVSTQNDFDLLVSGLTTRGEIKPGFKHSLSRLRTGVAFKIVEDKFDIWISRIIRKITSSSKWTQLEKNERIARVKVLFNRYYTLFGYSPFGDLDNLLFREIRHIIYTASTALYDTHIQNENGIEEPLIPNDSAVKLGEALDFWGVLHTWLSGTRDLSERPDNLINFKEMILTFLENKKKDSDLSLEDYKRIKAEIISTFGVAERIAKFSLYEHTFNYENSGFIQFIRSALVLLDPESRVFRSFSHLSKVLFKKQNYISDTARRNNRPEPIILFSSIYDSYSWDAEEDFKNLITSDEIERLAAEYRNLVKEFMFSNPQEYKPYITEKNEKGGST
ncbi:MAG: hypothetical protein P8Y70_20240 [Candidatus Lokiarchaeota archaeon]